MAINPEQMLSELGQTCVLPKTNTFSHRAFSTQFLSALARVLGAEIMRETIHINSEKSTANLKQPPNIFHMSVSHLACIDEEIVEHETYSTCHGVAAINFSFAP